MGIARTFVWRSRMPAPADAVYRFHARPEALEELMPPWEQATVVSRTGGIEQIGSRVTIRVPFGPLKQTWIAEHTKCEPGKMFQDVMISGPFHRWEHTHRFEPESASSSWLEDHVEYELPLGWIGDFFGSGYARKRLQRMFEWRHKRTAELVANM